MKNHGNCHRTWLGGLRRIGKIQFIVLALAVLWLTLLAASWSEAKAAAPSEESDDYSFTWLDPEKKIYVLQNRRYRKSNRALLSFMLGPGFSNPYRTTYNFDPRVSYYLSEAFGFEAFYTSTVNHTNSTFDALQRAAPNTWPVVREIRSQYGLLMHWVPWYAKLNVFSKILYFDWYFSAGAGTLQTALDTRTTTSGPSVYVDQNFTSFFLGTGHQYYLTNDIAIRLDFLGAFYRAPVLGLTGDDAWYSNYNFGFGVGLRI